MANYDIIGNIAIVKFDREAKLKAKKLLAKKLLKEYKQISTVLEKSNKFSGRLRTQKTKFVAGNRTTEALHKENGCLFRLNVNTCYFSPRLSSERLEVARKVKREESVLVLFGGVGPFAIVISKNSKAKKIVSIELGRECSKYAKENAKRNKLTNVEVIQGNVKTVLPKMKDKFERIVMARPNLKESFLDVALKRVKKNGTIHYYGFYALEDRDKLKEMIVSEARKARKKIKILKIKEAGEIGVKKFRYRVDFKVLN